MVEEEKSRVPLVVQCARIATPLLLILTVWQMTRYPGSSHAAAKLMLISSLLSLSRGFRCKSELDHQAMFYAMASAVLAASCIDR